MIASEPGTREAMDEGGGWCFKQKIRLQIVYGWNMKMQSRSPDQTDVRGQDHCLVEETAHGRRQ